MNPFTSTVRYPFSIITGQGLGTSYSSLEQVGEVIASKAFGRAGAQCYVNVTNGNLVVHDRQFHLHDIGDPFSIGYIYNSLVADPAQAWRLSVGRTLSLPARNGDPRLTVTETDGHQTLYQYSAQDNCYYAEGLAEGTPVITFDEGHWSYYHPKTREREIFNADGQIKMHLDATGHATHFIYDETKQPAHIHMHGGTEYEIARTKEQVAIYRINDNDRQLLQTYKLDVKGRVISSQPPHGEVVSYTYDSRTQLLSGVSQTDQTALGFTYENKRLATLQVGDPQSKNVNRFSYTQDQRVFEDACGIKTILTLDIKGRLQICEKTPTVRDDNNRIIDRMAFAYSTKGQVTSKTYPNRSAEVFDYDDKTGLLTGHMDRDGKATTFQYETSEASHHLLIAKIERHPDEHKSYVTRYIYDEKFNIDHAALRFTISPEGRVTEYLYDGKSGLMIGIRRYLSDLYPQLAETDHVSLADMNAWFKEVKDHQGLTQTSLTQFEHDAHGRITKTLQFARVEESGEGIYDENTSEEQCEWDAYDQLMAKHVVTSAQFEGKTRVSQSTLSSTFDYDDSETLLKKRVGVGTELEQKTAHVYAANTVTTTYPDQHTQVTTSNSEGLEQTIIEKSRDQQTAYEVTVSHAANTELEVVTLPDIAQLFLHDTQQDTHFSVNAIGKVTQIVTNKKINYEMTIEYAGLIDPAAVKNPKGDLDISLLQAALADKQNDTENRKGYKFFDLAGRDRYVVDALHYVTEYRYDGRGNIVAMIAHHDELSQEELTKLLAGGELERTPSRNRDRIQSYFFDGDNLKIAEQDPAGYITTLKRDAGGRIARQRIYEQPDLTFTNDFSQLTLTPNIKHDADHYYFYDNRGQCICEVDAEGYITTNNYYPNGKIKQTIRYEEKVLTDWYLNTNLPPNKVISANDHEVNYTYDELGRLSCERGPFDKMTTYAYDAMNRKIKTCIQDARHPEKTKGDHLRSTEQRYDELGRLVAEANPLVTELLHHIDQDDSRQDKTADKAAVWANQSDRYEYENKLKVRAIDPNGNVTRFYYDAAHRLVLTISHEGVVIQNKLNAFDEITKQRTYAAFIDPNVLATLQGGIINSTIDELLRQLKNDERDVEVEFKRDKRGQVREKTDENKHVSSFTYNAFKECEREQIPVRDATAPLTVIHEFDQRGLEVGITKTDAGTGFTTHVSKKRDNLHGKTTCITDAEEFKTQHEHDRLGRLVTVKRQVDATTELLDKQYAYDAFNRQIAVTNGLNQTTITEYEDAAHRQKNTHPNGDVETVEKNIFDESITITNPLGQTEWFEHTPLGVLRTHYHNDHQHLVHTEHDLAGRVTAETDANKVKTTYTYVGTHLTEKIADSNGKKLTTKYETNAFGKHAKETRPNGSVTTHAYDKKGQLLKTISDPSTDEHAGLDITAEYKYNPQGEKTRIIQGDVHSPNQSETLQIYDEVNRLTKTIIDPEGLRITAENKYDKNGNLIREISPLGFEHRHFYNGLGQKCFTYDPIDHEKGRLIEWVHDEVGNIRKNRIFAKTIAESVALNEETNLARLISVAQDLESVEDKETEIFYDELQRERFKINYLYDHTTGNYLGQLEEIRYDAAGHEQLHIHYATFVNRGEVAGFTTAQLAARAAQLQADPNNRITRKGFNVLGKEDFAIDPAGHLTEYYYDQMGQLTTEIHRKEVFLNQTEVMTLSDEDVKNRINPPPANAASDNDVEKRINEQPADTSKAKITHIIRDAFGNVTDKVNPLGGVTRRVYDADQNCVQKIKFKKPVKVTTNYADMSAEVSALEVGPEDSVTTLEYDAQKRLEKAIDPLGHDEIFKYDAVGNNICHIDRNKRSWAFHYDKARRLIEKITPEIDITTTSYVSALELKAETKKEKVRKRINYDAANNILAVTEGEGRKDARTFSTHFDALNRLISTEIPYVAIDDYSKPASFAQLPEYTEQVVATKIIYNTLGQKVAEKKEGNNWHFYTYDSLGRLTYEVNSKGEVTETLYDAFDQVNFITRYFHPIDATRISYKETGISLEEMQQLLVKNPDNDRKIELAYDSAGNVTQIEMNAVFFYSDFKQGVARPTTRKQFDAFGNCIQESQLIRPDVWKHKRKWYDAANNIIAETDEENHLTTYKRDEFGKELFRKEYKLPMTEEPDVTWSLDQLKAKVTVSPEDRKYFTTYDKLGQKSTEGLSNTVSQRLVVTDGSSCGLEDLPPSTIQKAFSYDPTQNLVGVTHENGLTEYKYLDARGVLIGETAVPRTPYGQAVSLTPLTTYGVNAFSERVTTTHHAQSPQVVTREQLPVVSPDKKDRKEVKVFDVRGQVKFKQDAENHIVTYTYTAARKPARHFYLNTTWTQTTAGLSTAGHIDEKRYVYDTENLLLQYTVMRDNQVEDVTYTAYNTFGESCEEHGYGTRADTYQYYNVIGQPFLTNQQDAVSTIKLYDLTGKETLSLQAPNLILQNANSPYASVLANNLEALLTLDAATLERTETTYNRCGQITAIREPHWYGYPSNGLPSKSLQWDRWHNLVREVDSFGFATDRKYNHHNLEIETIKPETTVLHSNGQEERKRPTTHKGYDVCGRLIGVRNPKGYTEGYTVDEAGQQIRRVTPTGQYDDMHVINIFGQVETSHCINGLTTHFEHNNMGQISKMIYPGGREQLFGYDRVGNRSLTTHPNSYSHFFNYDARQNITDNIQPSGDRTQWQYGRHNKMTLEVKPNGKKKTWARDPVGAVKEYTDLSGVVTKYDHDNTGRLRREYTVQGTGGHGGRLYVDYTVRGTAEAPIVIPNPHYEDNPPLLDLYHDYAFGLKYSTYDAGEKRRYDYAHDREKRRTEVKIWDLKRQKMQHQITADYDELGREARSDHVFLTATDFYSHFTSLAKFDENNNRKKVLRLLTPASYTPARPFEMQARESWYEHDARDRVTISDGIQLQNGAISITSGHGVSFNHIGNLRVGEWQVVNGTAINTTLIYTPEKDLATTASSNGITTHRNFLLQPKTGLPYTQYTEMEAGIIKSLKLSYFDSNMRELSTLNWTPELTHSTTLEYLPLWDIAWCQRGRTTETKPNQPPLVTDDTYIITSMGFSEEMPFAVQGTRTKYGKTTTGNSAQLYTARGRINGKWNAADEQEINMPDDVRPAVHFDITPDDWLLNKQAITTVPVSVKVNKDWNILVPAHTQSYYFFTNVNGKFLGTYPERTNFEANATGPVSIFKGRESYPQLGPFTCPEIVLPVGRTAITPVQLHCNPYALNDSTSPSIQPQVYIVKEGDTFASIAENITGEVEFANELAMKNGFLAQQRLAPGYTLFIPQFIPSKNRADNYHNYQTFISVIQGSLLPFMKTPHPSLPNQHGAFWKTIVKLIAVAIAMALVPAMAGFLGSVLLSTLTTTVGISAAATSTLSTVLTAVAAAINESIAQGVVIGLRAQDQFSVTEALETGLTYGLAGSGIQGIQEAKSLLEVSKAIVQVGAAALETQLIKMATGSRRKLDLGDAAFQMSTILLGAKLTPTLSKALGGGYLARASASATNTLMDAALGTALYHTPVNIELLSANLIGNSLGNALADEAAQRLKNLTETQDTSRFESDEPTEPQHKPTPTPKSPTPKPSTSAHTRSYASTSMTMNQPDPAHIETYVLPQPKLGIPSRASRWQTETLQRRNYGDKSNNNPHKPTPRHATTIGNSAVTQIANQGRVPTATQVLIAEARKAIKKDDVQSPRHFPSRTKEQQMFADAVEVSPSGFIDSEKILHDIQMGIKGDPRAVSNFAQDVTKEAISMYGVGKFGKTLATGGKLVGKLLSQTNLWHTIEVAAESAETLANRALNRIRVMQNEIPATSPNAAEALATKYRGLEGTQNNAVKTETLSDGRIRYYKSETPASKPGPTRGSAYVTEYNPHTGDVHSWMESYDNLGNVNRIHPKMYNGQELRAPHYPPTLKDKLESEYYSGYRR